VLAREAGVNNAALHYYFGTKDELISQAMAMTLEHMMEDSRDILSGEGDIQARLETLLDYLCEGILKFPNIIRAHLIGPFFEDQAESPFLKMIEVWITHTVSDLGDSLPDSRQSRMRLAIFSALCTALMAGLLPFSDGTLSTVDLRNEANRKAFVDHLVKSILQQD
jgi:AcrR family transcriptional regulator